MPIKATILGAIFAAIFIFGAASAKAQQVPTGACLLPDNTWCWPLLQPFAGQPCQCPGGAQGTMQ